MILKVDLGCGTSKSEGFIGLDRFPLPGVDIVCSLDEPLPLDTSSADLIYASHSLEHVADAMATMAEIYRVLRHGGQLCIVAPYSEQKLNIANPYHIAAFNEHTPRFWTGHPTAGVAEVEYFHPHAATWGAANSDHSTPPMDFRLVAMEFFYFPEYLKYSDEERRAFRQQRIDVCDQIMYHLIAWKPDEGTEEQTYESLLSGFAPYVPDYVIARRDADSEHSRCALAGRNAQVSNVFAPPLIMERGEGSRMISLVESLVNAREEAKEAEKRLHEMVCSLFENVERLQQDDGRVAALKAEIEVSDAIAAEHLAHTEELKAHVEQLEYYAASVREEHSKAPMYAPSQLSLVYNELSSYRESRAQRLANYIRSDSLWDDVSPAFADLQAFTQRNLRSAGYKLSLSGDLRTMDFREYRMPLAAERISKISLGIEPLGSTRGAIGVEIVSPQHTIVAQSMMDLGTVYGDRPTVFTLPSMPPLSRWWYLRVFVQNATAPVALYELIHPSIWRRRPIRRAFVSIQ